jgi:hypothetical protein
MFAMKRRIILSGERISKIGLQNIDVSPLPVLSLHSDEMSFEVRSRSTRVVQTLKDLGPLFIGIANLVLTATIAIIATEINYHQAQIADASFRDKLVAQLTGDQKQRDSGAVSLALYGREAWPAVVGMMGVDLQEVRDSVSKSVTYVFAAGLVPRKTVLKDVLAATENRVPAFRKTAWQSLRLMAEQGLLEKTESDEVLAAFRNRLVRMPEPDEVVVNQAFDTAVSLTLRYPNSANVICDAAALSTSAQMKLLVDKAKKQVADRKLTCS